MIWKPDNPSACELLLGRTFTEVWRRGEKYVVEGRVEIITEDARHIDALVMGTQNYHVSISFAANGLSKKCDCPYAAGSKSYHAACKHMAAVAIVWDKLRGLSSPDGSTVEHRTVPPPKVSGAQITALFKYPLKADLAILRIVVDERGGWTRPHSKLPDCPVFCDDVNLPLSLDELKIAFREMVKWTKRRAYDPYFCAGEMTAAFCQLLRIAKTRIAASDAVISAQFLLEAQLFHYKLVQDLIDDSDGMHKFLTAYLDDFHEAINMAFPISFPAETESLLDQYLQARNKY